MMDEDRAARECKIIVEKYPDGYVAYPLGIRGTVVGEGDTYEEALADVKSAIEFHIETFGSLDQSAANNEGGGIRLNCDLRIRRMI